MMFHPFRAWDYGCSSLAPTLNASSQQINPANNLVAWKAWHLRTRQLTISDMQVRAEDAASGDLDPNLIRS